MGGGEGPSQGGVESGLGGEADGFQGCRMEILIAVGVSFVNKCFNDGVCRGVRGKWGIGQGQSGHINGESNTKVSEVWFTRIREFEWCKGPHHFFEEALARISFLAKGKGAHVSCFSDVFNHGIH